ncbi:MAG: proton-conducting transporter membrane subunit, partial [Desulfonatronovibrio sp.]
MGFVTLGIFVLNLKGLEGAVIQMINHGITTGALFMLVGLIYERSHSREIKDNMGIAKFLPAYIFFFGLFSLSSLAFPGTNSFVGEALVLIGAFEHSLIIGLLGVPGALLAAAYMLRLLQKIAYGQPVVEKARQWKDLNFREWAYLLPLGVLVLYIGLAPALALKTMTASIEKVIGYTQPAVSMADKQNKEIKTADFLESRNLFLQAQDETRLPSPEKYKRR